MPAEAENDAVIPTRVIPVEMVPANNHSERQPSRKATLYCTSCEHASLINGDWIIHVHDDYLEYECPACGATINSHRNRSDLTSQSEGVLQFSPAD
jgi:predicted RNA-binding Zn-ribbon protein involved in translation (DUF1610 family)